MRQKEAMSIARQHGYVLKRVDDEYRIVVRGGSEEEAYYTPDLDDAINTMREDILHRRAYGAEGRSFNPRERGAFGESKSTIYRGYRIVVHDLFPDRIWIEKDGQVIVRQAASVEDAKRTVEMLTANPGVNPAEMKVGDPVYFRSVTAGNIPAKITAIDGREITVQITATRGAWKRGMETVGSRNYVFPRTGRNPEFSEGMKGPTWRGVEDSTWEDAVRDVAGELIERTATLRDIADQYENDDAPTNWIVHARAMANVYEALRRYLDEITTGVHGGNPDDGPQSGGIHIDIGSHNRNPAILVASNPGVLIGDSVHKVYYHHVTEGNRVHVYEVEGVRMEGLRDGSVRIYHPSLPIWGNE
jgi:hypothetical protein